MEQEQGMMLIDTDVLINLFDLSKAKHSFAQVTIEHLKETDTDLFVSIITQITARHQARLRDEETFKRAYFFQNINFK